MIGTTDKTTGECETPAQKRQILASKLLIKSEKSRETLALIGFVMALGGLVVSFFGSFYTGVLPVIELYCAFQGLHSKKSTLSKFTCLLVLINISVIVVETIKFIFFE